ncbi:DUF262 domain-containing protein [Rhizobium sp. 007]|uniref:DUF262 domain-containing protein n=1 Tax=Rhizobium sp. 007 TaxID=2785056 RepID=UPI001890948D|nr:DUF262 domain-containing protein [Rhizobium sp. 007]QPB24444.1 DUF262 domain-containing protein [Rhizobium sp. 007]
MVKINRRPGTQDISWFLDQNDAKRLDLDPPYQRRSVWTSKDRRYFLDTVFRGFPCPPIYLHKTIDSNGASIYHVVDGKQRIETILRFAKGKVRLPEDYGDDRLNNKRWPDITADTEMRNQFLNYAFVVEYFDDVDSTVVNEIFSRMNKNSRKLTQQEIRNARFDGWLSRQIDSEVEETIWKQIGIVTTGRARRMADVQFIAELFMIVLQGEIIGFNHDAIDLAFAEHEDISDPDNPFDAEKFTRALVAARSYLAKMYDCDPSIAGYLSSVSNTYILWAVLVLYAEKLPDPTALVKRYSAFMGEVSAVGVERKRIAAIDPDDGGSVEGTTFSDEAEAYFGANQSATTEYPQRQRRLLALKKALKIED